MKTAFIYNIFEFNSLSHNILFNQLNHHHHHHNLIIHGICHVFGNTLVYWKVFPELVYNKQQISYFRYYFHSNKKSLLFHHQSVRLANTFSFFLRHILIVNGTWRFSMTHKSCLPVKLCLWNITSWVFSPVKLDFLYCVLLNYSKCLGNWKIHSMIFLSISSTSFTLQSQMTHWINIDIQFLITKSTQKSNDTF